MPATAQQQGLLPTTLQKVINLRETYPSLSAFGAAFSPQETARFARYPERCFTGEAPSLSRLDLAYGETASIVWLIAHLQSMQEAINVPNKMTVTQLDTCAQTISEEFSHLKTTELMLFFARLIGGAFPVEWYGYISPDKILKALREHFMPWRDQMLHTIHKQEEQRKINEATSGITWEQYCMNNYGELRPSPLDSLTQTQQQ